MPVDFAALKAQTRRIVHDTLAIDAAYEDANLAGPIALRIRWHNKLLTNLESQDEGYSTFLTSVKRIIFDRDELAAKGVVIQRGGKLKITSPGFNNAVLAIDTRDTMAGPTEEIWMVGKI